MRELVACYKHAVALGLGFCVLGSCGSPPAATAPRPSLIEDAELSSGTGFISPARWDYHPQEFPEFVSAVPLSSGGQLLLSANGERWKWAPSQRYAQVAMPAPEPLLTSLNLGADGWLFVGASGTTYEAQQPLGSFLRSSTPPQPLVRVATSQQALVAVDTRGQLVRSVDLGLSWQSLPVPGRFADVALLADGAGLALLVPEQLLKTSNHGETWQPLSQPPFGAVQLRQSGDALQVLSLLRSKTFAPGRTQTWRDGIDKKKPLAINAKLPSRPSAEAVAEHRAFFEEGKYVELRQDTSGWKLLSGIVSEPLKESPLAIAKGCRRAQLTGRNQVLYLACVQERAEVGRLKLWRSDDSGRSWTADASGLRVRMKDLRLLALKNGSLVMSGICAPDKSEPGCQPQGVYARSERSADRQRQSSLRPAIIPALRGLPQWLGASPDGTRVFALGSRTKNDALVVFSSNDSGKTFRASEVKGMEAFSSDFRAQRELLEVTAASVGDDAHLSIALKDDAAGESRLLVLDEQGQIVSLGRAPAPKAVLAGAGLLAMAYDARGGELWESADGGLSWQSLGGLPLRFCDSAGKNCAPVLTCHARGCTFGDKLSRVGWGGQPQLAFSSPSLNRAGSGQLGSGPQRSPFSCRFREQSQWSSLRGRMLPGASQAGLGDVAWFAFDASWDDGSVLVHQAAWSPEGSVVHAPLFEPISTASQIALYASLQIEGVAALRSRKDRVEVAWIDFFQSGKPQKFVFPARFKVANSAARSIVHVADPALVSIAPGGLFVRAEDAAPTYFTDGRSLSEIPPLPTIALPGRDEMVRADGQSIAIRLLGAGAGIVRSRLIGGEWQQDATAVGLIDPEPFELPQRFDIAYVGQRSGFHLMHLSQSGPKGWVFPFSAGSAPFSSPIEVPSQSQLSDPPKPCSAETRAQSPRVILPKQPGTQHPVIVTDSAEPIGTLLTEEAVLYGTPAQPCAAYYEAASEQRSGNEEYRALVSVDDRYPSWLFRVVPNTTTFEYRPLDCKADPQRDVLQGGFNSGE